MTTIAIAIIIAIVATILVFAAMADAINAGIREMQEEE